MKPTPAKQSLSWNVAFERGRTPWGHVLAFAWTGDIWLVVDPHVRWTEVFTLTALEFDDWVADLSARAEVWRLDGRGEAPLLPGWFCVAQVKRLVGLRSGALFPGGLRRDLVKAGARQVFIRESQNPEGRPAHQVGP